jgi:glucose-1-phosphate thymidylyltransferase
LISQSRGLGDVYKRQSLGKGTRIQGSIISNSNVQAHATIENAIIANSMIGSHATFSGAIADISLGDYSTVKQ